MLLIFSNSGRANVVSYDIWACPDNVVFTLYDNWQIIIRMNGKEKERINVVEFNELIKKEKEGKKIIIKDGENKGRIKSRNIDIFVDQWPEFKMVIDHSVEFLKGRKNKNVPNAAGVQIKDIDR